MIGTPILAQPIGLARLAKMAFDGADLSLLWDELSVRALALPPDADALMQANETFSVADVFAWTVVLVLILMAANVAVTAVERRLLVWRE